MKSQTKKKNTNVAHEVYIRNTQTCDITNIVCSQRPMMCPFKLKLHFTEKLKVLSCHAHTIITTACQVCNFDVGFLITSTTVFLGKCCWLVLGCAFCISLNQDAYMQILKTVTIVRQFYFVFVMHFSQEFS